MSVESETLHAQKYVSSDLACRCTVLKSTGICDCGSLKHGISMGLPNGLKKDYQTCCQNI